MYFSPSSRPLLPLLTDYHVVLRVCSEVGLTRSPLCGAPRRDSHSAFLDGYTAPPSPSSSFPLHPLTHGFITTVNNGCSHTNPTTTTKQKDKKRQKIIYIFFYFWVPRNQLGFKLAGSVVAHKYGSRMERENHLTTDLLQMSTNENILGFLKKKKGFPPPGATSR